MLYAPDGRLVRRAIGFVRNVVIEREAKAKVDLVVCGFQEIAAEEYVPIEECERCLGPASKSDTCSRRVRL